MMLVTIMKYEKAAQNAMRMVNSMTVLHNALVRAQACPLSKARLFSILSAQCRVCVQVGHTAARISLAQLQWMGGTIRAVPATQSASVLQVGILCISANTI